MSEPFFTAARLERLSFSEKMGSDLGRSLRIPRMTDGFKDRLKDIVEILSYFSLGLPILFIDESDGNILEHSESVEDITFWQIKHLSYYYEPSSVMTDRHGDQKYYKLYCKRIKERNVKENPL